MTDTLTIVGQVATDPIRGRTAGGVPVTNFRVASTQRRPDPATGKWVDAGTNWYSVAAFRQLGEHAKASLHTGDSVIITGRLKIRNWESNGKRGTSVDIDADAIGHDLRWGTSAYLRASRAAAAESPADQVQVDRAPAAEAAEAAEATEAAEEQDLSVDEATGEVRIEPMALDQWMQNADSTEEVASAPL